jgi:hypothetical protein
LPFAARLVLVGHRVDHIADEPLEGLILDKLLLDLRVLLQ